MKKDFVYWVFLLIGSKFYLDWILPTNPMSKNKLIIRLFWGGKQRKLCRNYNERLIFAYIYMGIHVFFALLMLILNSFFTLSNILINIYPIFVQLYIIYRILKIKTRKKQLLINLINN